MSCLGCALAALLLLLTLATRVPAQDAFVAVRSASTNRTLLCWAIKLSPAAYVADAECVRSYRKHQIVLIYGDVAPGPSVRERLGRKVAGLRQPPCRHRVPPLALVGSGDRSALGPTVRNFIASYGMQQAARRTATCRECRVLAVRRVIPCRAAPADTVVLYTDCLQQVSYGSNGSEPASDSFASISSHPSIPQLDTKQVSQSQPQFATWAWKLRRKLKRTLYEDLERQARQRLEMLNFIANTRR